MGCVSSKVEVEERVSACRKEKEFAKKARKSQNAFAAAHAEYLRTLGNIGKAFWNFAEVEFRGQDGISTALPASSPYPPSNHSLIQLPSPPDSPPPIPAAAETPKKVTLSPKAQKNTPFLSEKVAIIPSPLVLPQPSSPKKKPEDFADQSTQDNYFFYDESNVQIYEEGLSSAAFLAQSLSPSPNGFVPAPSAMSWDWFGLFQPATMPAAHFKEQKIPEPEATAMKIVDEDDVPMESMRAEPAVPKLKQEPKEVLGQDSQKAEVKGREKGNEGKEKLVPQRGPKNEDLQQETVEEKTEMPETKVEEKKEREKKMLTAMVSKDPLEVFKNICELFSTASESGQDISRLLDARKATYNSSLSDSRGFSDQSSSKLFSDQSLPKLAHGISWGSSSPRTPLSFSGTETSEESSVGDEGGVLPDHASTLGKLCTLEKRLYEQTKALESINLNLQRKRKLLFNLDMRGTNNERRDNTRVAISNLENRMIIANEDLRATFSEIKGVTSGELYPRMLELLNGLIHMWRETHECCIKQGLALSMFRNVQNTSLEATSSHHKHMGEQLDAALIKWQKTFQTQIGTQREYIHDVYHWLWVSLRETESDPKTKALYNLCGQWKYALDKLPATHLSDEISKFAKTVQRIVNKQEDELKIHRKRDAIAKELTRKIAALHDAERRTQNEKRKRAGDKAEAPSGEISEPLLSEKRALVNKLKETMEKEKENFRTAMNETRAVTLESIKESLPALLQALAEFAKVCMNTYQDLHTQCPPR